MTWVHVALPVLVTIIVLVIAVSRSYALGRESGERDTLAGQGSDSGSLFGTDVPVRKRSHGKGLADHIFMKGKLKEWDRAGGGLNLCESFVTVSRAA